MMRRSIHALLCAVLAIAGITAALSDQYPVRATTTPPTVGAACNATYQMGIYIEISSGDEYYCDVGLWSKRAAGGGTAPDLWKTIDTPSGTDLTADNTADTLIFAAGAGISITGDGTNTVTIASTGGGGDWVTKGIDLDGNGTNAQFEYDATATALLGTPDADGTPNFKWTGGAVPKFYVGSNLLSAYSFFTETAFFGSQGLGISSYQEQLFLADADGTDNGGMDLGTDRRFAFATSVINGGYEFDIDGSLNIVGINPDGDGTVDYKFCVDNGGASGEVLKMGGSNCIAWGSDLGANIDFDLDGTYEIEADGTSVKLDPASDGTPAWEFCEDTPAAGEVAYYDGTAGCWKSATAASAANWNADSRWIQQPWNYIEFWDDFLYPWGNDAVSNALKMADAGNLNVAHHNQVWSTKDHGGAIGVLRVIPSTTANSYSFAGIGNIDQTEVTSLKSQSASNEEDWWIEGMTHFRTRGFTYLLDDTADDDGIVFLGGIKGAQVRADSIDIAVGFYCRPDDDLDDDGTASDGAEDDNWWALTDVDPTEDATGGRAVCLINGSGGCSTTADRVAVDTGIECEWPYPASDTNPTAQVFEITHVAGSSDWDFKIDGNDDGDFTDAAGTDYSGTLTNDFAANDWVLLWGIAVRQGTATADSAGGFYADYLYYRGVRP
jgi:hypothetical protein